jgi:dTDP-4-dehydrorhamnose reductase
MKMQKVLITGGSGLLGVSWGLAIKNNYKVILGLHNKSVKIEGIETITLDIENIKCFRATVDKVCPDIIVHSAGMTSVEQCEGNPDMASYLNSTLAENVATVCSEKNIKLIHISTDHLYDGSKANVTERELTCPINAYGISKLKGEMAVAKAYPESLIVRTNFFGWGGPYKQSFSDWVIDNLRAGNKIKAFDDVFYTPILIDRLVFIAMSFIESDVKGRVNIVGDERISKYVFCCKISKQFNLPQNLIEKAKIADANQLTRRPKDMSLSNEYAQTLYGEKIGTIDDFIFKLKTQEEAGMAKIVRNSFL